MAFAHHKRHRPYSVRGQWISTYSYADGPSGLTIPSQFFVPADADKNVAKRLIIYVGGSGNRGNNNLTLGNELGAIVDQAKATFPYYCLIPQYPAGSVGTEPAAIRRAIFGLLSTLKGLYNIDSKKVVYTGYSTGGILGWDMLYDDWKYYGGQTFCAAALMAPSMAAAHLGDPTKGPVVDYLATYPDAASLSTAAADTVFWDFMDGVIGNKPVLECIGVKDTTVRYNVDGTGTWLGGTNSSKALFNRWTAIGRTVVDTNGPTGGTFATTDKRILSGWGDGVNNYDHSLGTMPLGSNFGSFTTGQVWSWINAQALP